MDVAIKQRPCERGSVFIDLKKRIMLESSFSEGLKVGSLEEMHRGAFFSLDAMLALVVVISGVVILAMLSFGTVSSEQVHQQLSSQAEDLVSVIADVKVKDVRDEPVVDKYFNDPYRFLNDTYLDKTLLEVIGEFWSTGEANMKAAAEDILEGLFKKMVPQGLGWSVKVEDEAIYSSDTIPSAGVMAVARRVASGFKKLEPVLGCVSDAYLENIRKKSDSRYVFFGGFVGQGNLTMVMRDLPSDSIQVTKLYIEGSFGDSFRLYVDGVQCGGLFLRTPYSEDPQALKVDNWSVALSCSEPNCFQDPNCIRALNDSAGNPINLFINFSSQSISNKSVGGGFMRIDFDTREMAPRLYNTTRYYFPGVDGVINLYDSFYVPGNVSGVDVHLKLNSSYRVNLTVANVTVESTTPGIMDVQVIDVSDSVFRQRGFEGNYSWLNSKTFPLRLFLDVNITGEGIGDVVLITDVSGSMDWSIGSEGSTGVARSCTDPSLFNSDTKRISLAKCLDKMFVQKILSQHGNRVGIVNFSTNATASTDPILSKVLTGNQTFLNKTIESYPAVGGTCISCAIEKARQVLLQESPLERKKYIIVMSDGIAGFKSGGTDWDYRYDWTNDRQVDYVQRSLAFIFNGTAYIGFSVGNNGRVYRWNSTSFTAWPNVASPTSNTLRGVAFVNKSLAFAVGDSGTMIRWDGVQNKWFSVTPLVTERLSGISFAGDDIGFAVGDNGRILKWNGVQWSIDSSPTSRNLKAVSFINSTLAFAVGEDGTLLRWSGFSWTQEPNIPDKDLLAISLTPSFGLAGGERGTLLRWDGFSWSQVSSPQSSSNITAVMVYGPSLALIGYFDVYSFQSSGGANNSAWMWYDNVGWGLSTYYDRIGSTTYKWKPHNMVFINASLGFAAVEIPGSKNSFQRWDPSRRKANGTETNSSYYSCNGNSDDCDNVNCLPASDNAVYRAEFANKNESATLFSVGFGPVENCFVGNYTLHRVALAGNGTYYHSSSPVDLEQIYSRMAERILVELGETQEARVIGMINTTLYPDSFIQFNFTPETIPFGKREIVVSGENKLNGCEGNASLPFKYAVFDARVASYSSKYWSDLVLVKNSLTENSFRSMFNLSDYKTDYRKLGDPFVVRFDSAFIKTGENTTINATSHEFGNPYEVYCSPNNKFIYKARFNATVPFGNVGRSCTGGNTSVCFQLEGQAAPTCRPVWFGETQPGFDSTNQPLEDIKLRAYSDGSINNSIYASFLTLLSTLRAIPCENPSDVPGSTSCPIQVELTDTIGIGATTFSGIPYSWGPIEMDVVIWQKGA
ncbi:VWA domain-containing protein [Candidatus Micrarchaeota archaeon]|nr:VWA domain-containing protein [Candidatus Micrarchaeota archaeon]